MKLASYNIHKGIGADRRRDPGRIIDVLNTLDADIVTLQEADRRFGQRQAVIPPFLLASHSDYRAVELDVQTDSMGWHGNGILVRQGVELLEQDILHIPHLEPRGCVTALLEVGGCKVRVFGMHLDLSGLWRRRQARRILDLAGGGEAEHPTVLMGDLNEWRPRGGCLSDFGGHFTDAPCGRSFPARSPVGRLDRILFSEHFKLRDCGVLNDSTTRIASDHLPVWAELEVR